MCGGGGGLSATMRPRRSFIPLFGGLQYKDPGVINLPHGHQGKRRETNEALDVGGDENRPGRGVSAWAGCQLLLVGETSTNTMRVCVLLWHSGFFVRNCDGLFCGNPFQGLPTHFSTATTLSPTWWWRGGGEVYGSACSSSPATPPAFFVVYLWTSPPPL